MNTLTENQNQSPIRGDRVKRGGTVYVVIGIVATRPDFVRLRDSAGTHYAMYATDVLRYRVAPAASAKLAA